MLNRAIYRSNRFPVCTTLPGINETLITCFCSTGIKALLSTLSERHRNTSSYETSLGAAIIGSMGTLVSTVDFAAGQTLKILCRWALAVKSSSLLLRCPRSAQELLILGVTKLRCMTQTKNHHCTYPGMNFGQRWDNNVLKKVSE